MSIVSRWKAVSIQDRLVGLVLAMAVVIALIAAPASIKMPAAAPLALEGFGILLLGVLLLVTKWSFRSDVVKASLRSGTGVAALALAGTAFLSCIFSHNRALSLQGAMQIGVGVLLYFVVSYQFRRSHQLSRFSDVVVFVAIVGAVIGCAQYGANPDGQASGLFGDHQLYGSFLMVLLPFLAVSAMTEKVVNRQLAAQTATVLATIALLLAHSRSAWIGAASGLVAIGALSLLFPVKGKRELGGKRNMLVPGLLMAAGVGFFLLVSPIATSILERANTLTAVGSQEAWQDRQHVWHGALRMIADHPLTGLGPSMYPYSHYDYTHLSVPIGQLHTSPSLADQTHNLYLQTAAEIGVPGAVALIMVLVTFWVGGVKRLRTMEAGVRRNILLGALGATVAFAVDAFASPSWQFGQVVLFFWLAVGIGEACTKDANEFETKAKVNSAPIPTWVRRPAFAFGMLALAALAPAAVNASRFTSSTAYNGVTSIKLVVFPDEGVTDSAIKIASYPALFNSIALANGISPAGAPPNELVPYPLSPDPSQTTTSGTKGHYKLQLYVNLQSGVGGPITLDSNTVISPVTQGFVGGGAMVDKPYTYPTDNPNGNTFNYGNYGDYKAYIDQPQDQGFVVTVDASYNGQHSTAALDFTGSGGIAGRIGGSGGGAMIGTAVAAVGAGALLIHEYDRHNHHDKNKVEHVAIEQAGGASEAGVIKLSAKLYPANSATGTPITMDAHTSWSVSDGDGYLKPGADAEEFHFDPADAGKKVTITVTYTGASGTQTATLELTLPN